MKSLLGAILLLTALSLAYWSKNYNTSNPTVLSASTNTENQNLQPIKTESLFSEKLIEDTTIIPKKTTYLDDPDTEAGIDTVLEEGADGKKTTVTKITYYEGKLYDKEIVATEITDPKDKVIKRGTKIIWKTLETQDGEIKYWKKLRVWATHYDSHCLGCDAWTAIGMRQGKGVIAVDPKIIKLRSKIYIPGYGIAIAGDTGGAIKGNIIDLGFEDARTAGWRAKFVDIFILN